MIKVRIKFYKTGSMKFIGHLDVMRYFQKAIRRSGLPVAYSQGFSPHQLISFASPLGVGCTSDAEYMDMQLTQEIEPEVIKDLLNETMSEEMQVINVTKQEKESKTSMALLCAADYLVSVKDGYPVCGGWRERLHEFLNQERIPICKKTKKSEEELDLSQYIYAFAFEREAFAALIAGPVSEQAAGTYENGHKLYVRLANGSVHNIKPDLVMEEFCKWSRQEYNPFAYQMHRLEMYTDLHAKKGEIFLKKDMDKQKLTALDKLGV